MKFSLVLGLPVISGTAVLLKFLFYFRLNLLCFILIIFCWNLSPYFDKEQKFFSTANTRRKKWLLEWIFIPSPVAIRGKPSRCKEHVVRALRSSSYNAYGCIFPKSHLSYLKRLTSVSLSVRNSYWCGFLISTWLV